VTGTTVRRAVAFATACALIALPAFVATARSAATVRAEDAWQLANHDLSSTRSAAASGIDRTSASGLRVAWRFRSRTQPGESGVLTPR
jgi:hypothetical protein